jgi:uncharacterized membrane protein
MRKENNAMTMDYTQVYHVVAYEFAGQDRALQVADLVRKGSRVADYRVAAWAVVEVDGRGKAHVRQSGHGGKGTALGMGAGAMLGLIGGPAGLLVWTLGGALIGGLAGKYMGHQFDPDALKALTMGMGPNTSAILVVIEDRLAQSVADEMGQFGAKVVTLTLGSQLSGELASFGAVSLADVTEEEEIAGVQDPGQLLDQTQAVEPGHAHEPGQAHDPAQAYDQSQAQADALNRIVPHI